MAEPRIHNNLQSTDSVRFQIPDMNHFCQTLFRSTRAKKWGVLVAAIIAILTALLMNTDRARYERALRGVRESPEKWIGLQASVDTWDCVGVSSKFIAASVEQAYQDLGRSFSVKARTYYSECGDMPTQESIWQFNGYFVWLYTTSALECDGCSVGVFEGTYEVFRAEWLKPDTEPLMKFNIIEYQSPRRFLYPDR